MKLVVATKNMGKIREIKEILKDTDWEILSMKDVGINIDVVEDADTFEGNAIKKAQEIMKICNCVTLADDSGLVVEALNGEPGIYSARYSGENATDELNNQKLLKKMENQTNRNAKFVCAIALSYPDGTVKTVRGEFEGQIAYSPKGSGGFGYDVIFYLPQYGKTSAELEPELKNKISHRGMALKLLKGVVS